MTAEVAAQTAKPVLLVSENLEALQAEFPQFEVLLQETANLAALEGRQITVLTTTRQPQTLYERVAAFAEGKPYVSVEDVMYDCLHIGRNPHIGSYQVQVAAILRQLGRRKAQLRFGQHRTWAYIPVMPVPPHPLGA